MTVIFWSKLLDLKWNHTSVPWPIKPKMSSITNFWCQLSKISRTMEGKHTQNVKNNLTFRLKPFSTYIKVSEVQKLYTEAKPVWNLILSESFSSGRLIIPMKRNGEK